MVAAAKVDRQKVNEAIWHGHYCEKLIPNKRAHARHVDYRHYNPAKQGYVARVCEWAYSTFHRYIRAAVYTSGWAGTSDGLEE